MGCGKPVSVVELILKWMKSFTVCDHKILCCEIVFTIESESECESESESE